MSLLGLLVKVGAGLGFVVLLAWVCVFLLKKSAVGQQFSSRGGVRVLERSYLAPKRAIYLVEIGDRTLALGVTEQNISVLSHWGIGELQLPQREEVGAGLERMTSFASQFRSLLSRRGAEGAPDIPGSAEEARV
ncbi:FliO/MopB family protein [Candidatus Latescibacterota bacterium]